jgi:phosphodiesterase/alkaline phosphatase D-like protein
MSEFHLNRRAFLTGTAVVAGGLVLGIARSTRRRDAAMRAPVRSRPTHGCRSRRPTR